MTHDELLDGGFANRLIIHLIEMQEAIYECKWCLLKINVNLLKGVTE